MLIIDPQGRPQAATPSLQRHLASLAGPWELVPIPTDVLMFRPAANEAEEPQSFVALMGQIRTEGALADIATLIHGARWTGILYGASPGFSKAIEFETGDVVSTRSDVDADRLGNMLCQLGFIDERQLQEALDDPSRSCRLGAWLVGEGLITHHDLYRAMHLQVAQVFQSFLTLAEGYFAFEKAIRAVPRGPGLRVSTQQLLLTGLQRIDELKSFRPLIPHIHAVFERTGRDAATQSLESSDKRVLETVDGERHLGEVARLCHFDEYEVTSAAFRLSRMGLISIARCAPRTHESPDERVTGEGGIVSAFNRIFSKVFERAEHRGALRSSVESYLCSRPAQSGDLFEGVTMQADGTLDAHALLRNLERQPEPDRAERACQELNDYLFFLTFVAGETLDHNAERAFRRIEHHLRASSPQLGEGKDEPGGES